MKRIILLLIVICVSTKNYAQTQSKQLTKVTMEINGRAINILPSDFAKALRNKNSSPFSTSYDKVISGFAKKEFWNVPEDSVIPIISRAERTLFDSARYGPVHNSGVNLANGEIEVSEHFILDKEPIYQDPVTGRAWKENCANPLPIFNPILQDLKNEESIADLSLGLGVEEELEEDSVVYVPGKIDTVYKEQIVYKCGQCPPVNVNVNINECCPSFPPQRFPIQYSYYDSYRPVYYRGIDYYNPPQMQQSFVSGNSYDYRSYSNNGYTQNRNQSFSSNTGYRPTSSYNNPRPSGNPGFNAPGCCGGGGRPGLGAAGVYYGGSNNGGSHHGGGFRPPG